jgi:hypothetical protein
MPTELQLEQRYQAPYAAWRQRPQDPAATGALLRALEPVVSAALRSYAGAAAGPVLRGRARRIVLDSLPRYDPGRAKLATFLTRQLQGLRRARFEIEQPVRLPEQLRLDRHRAETARRELADQLGREPSTAELADAAGLNPARLARALKASPGLVEGALTRYGDEEGDVFAPAVAGTVGGPAGPGSAAANRPWLELVYHSVGPADQVVLEHSLGLFGRPKLSNNDIARRLGVTPSAVSQRRTRIQGLIDQRPELGLGVFGNANDF